MTGLARGGVAGVGLELAASPVSAAKPLSVVVAGVVEGSPAAKAGVMTGDELSAVDGEEVKALPLLFCSRCCVSCLRSSFYVEDLVPR